jgi:uncharacterized protein
MSNAQNRLASEKSPYLLQHAGNPVDWYPWGEEAFARAERESKPILLSIGYSTCHWCHVMAHESFEDPAVARLINDTFVSVKVDREERPDIDMEYMRVCHMMTGSGGWPLTIIMTPNKEPFFAATYLPRETRFGRIGLMDLVPQVKQLWSTRREELQTSAQGMTNALRESMPDAGGPSLGESELRLCYGHLHSAFDREWGGFGTEPKFPSPHTVLFLLRYWRRTGEREALSMVEKTLQAMQQGGIHDHIGGGFHRYSTDRHWLVPHFEKMLYDQALLATAFVEAHQATHKEEYALTARGILDYVLRDMTSPSGGFYSAEDADSEGEEGKFYLWTIEEIQNVLDSEDAALFIRAFNIEEDGNFTAEVPHRSTGANIPHLRLPLGQVAVDSGIGLAAALQRLESARQRLFLKREERIHPRKDDKILTDWNGLMVAAMAQAARALDEPSYEVAARRAVDFVLGNMVDSEGRLLHRFRDGEAAIHGNLDDYAFFIYGLLELYETSFDTAYLKRALALHENMTERFWDTERGGFYFTPDDGEQILARQKETYDGAVPSGNSIAMLNALRLSRLTGNTELDEIAARTGKAFGGIVRLQPSGHAQFMVALDFALGPSYEVVVAGEPLSSDAIEMLHALATTYLPNKVTLLVAPFSDIAEIAPFTRDMVRITDKATAYVCSNNTCQSPTTEIPAMLRLLNAELPS